MEEKRDDDLAASHYADRLTTLEKEVQSFNYRAKLFVLTGKLTSMKERDEELLGSLKPPKLGTNRFLTYDGDMTVAYAFGRKRFNLCYVSRFKTPSGFNGNNTTDANLGVSSVSNKSLIRVLLETHSEICEKEEVTLDTSYRILLKCADGVFKKLVEIHRLHETPLEEFYPRLLERFEDFGHTKI